MSFFVERHHYRICASLLEVTVFLNCILQRSIYMALFKGNFLAKDHQHPQTLAPFPIPPNTRKPRWHAFSFSCRLTHLLTEYYSTGSISFLNTWKYTEGINILSPWGRQELYDSGVLHNYEYGHLYDPNSGKKIIARSTTMDRMVKSAEVRVLHMMISIFVDGFLQNFLSGFFGLSWQNNATLELIIDETGFNNSLAGYNACPVRLARFYFVRLTA